MTLEELEKQMPNGLHDADLLEFKVDLAAQTLTLSIDADCTSPVHKLPDGEPPTRPAVIVIKGLCYFLREPPDLVNRGTIDAPSPISSGAIERGAEEIPSDVWQCLPESAFTAWIYFNYWNSFMRFAGTDAELTWPLGKPKAFYN